MAVETYIRKKFSYTLKFQHMHNFYDISGILSHICPVSNIYLKKTIYSFKTQNITIISKIMAVGKFLLKKILTFEFVRKLIFWSYLG